VTEVLAARNLVAYYQRPGGGWTHAVDDVTLFLNQGEVLGIAGESGCGKSTLASLLSLTIRPPLSVRGGSLAIDGRQIPITEDDGQAVTADLRGTLVSLLPQYAMNSLNPTQRVRSFVVDVLRSHIPEMTREEATERARHRLEQLSLPERVLDAYPHQLSGGMRQRVVAVISTLLNPKILVADEPTSALDVSSQRALLALLRRLLGDGIIGSIIFVTHELPVLRHISDRIMVMYAGQLAEIGPTESVISAPAHPYTTALLNATLDLETATRSQRIPDFAGAPPDLTDPPAGCRFSPRCPHAMDECRRLAPRVIEVRARHEVACWWVSKNLATRHYEETGSTGALSQGPRPQET